MISLLKKLIPRKVKLLLYSIFINDSLNQGERIYWVGDDYPPKGTTAAAHWVLYNLVLPYIKPNYRVLDVGCGSGFGSYIVAKKASKVVAFDHSLKAIRYCQRYNYAPNIEFILSSVDNFHTKEKFDLILMIEFLEHNRKPKKILAKMFTLLKDKGKIIVTFPRLPEGTPLVRGWHLYEFTDSRVKEVFSNYNYEVKGLKNLSNIEPHSVKQNNIFCDVKEASNFFYHRQKINIKTIK